MQKTQGHIKQKDSRILFPRPFAIAIDDMGWNIGNNDGDIDGLGPFRIGLNRKMNIKDYQAIAKVGSAVGVRIQGLFVLAEMDRENILSKHPTTTWQGHNWDNSENICLQQNDIMEICEE